MACLIDTNVAILLRDREPEIMSRLDAMSGNAMISIITQVELEGGVYRDPKLSPERRAALDILLQGLIVLPFTIEAVRAYARIVERLGYSRARLIDRMIAATALVHDLPIVTINGPDFREIPDLRLEVWPHPIA